MAKRKKKKNNVKSWGDIKTEALKLVKHVKKGDEQAEIVLLQKMRTDSRYLVVVRNLAHSKKGKDNRGDYAKINIDTINRGGVWGYQH